MQFNNELQRAFREKNLQNFEKILKVFDVDPNSYPDGSDDTNFEIILKTPGSSEFIAKCLKYGADFNVKKAVDRDCIVLDVDPNSYPDGSDDTNFEIILKTPGSSEFIAKCLKYGADFNVKHPFQESKYKYPLHYVMESECLENLKAVQHLLNHKKSNNRQSPFVNVKDIKGRNCLHMLCEEITNTNYDELFSMMKILLSYGCNVESEDNQGKTPISIMTDKHKTLRNGYEILKYLKDQGSSKSTENEQLSYPFKKEHFDASFLSYMDLLRNGNINKFENKFPELKGMQQAYRTNLEGFLQVAIEARLTNIIDLLINKICDLKIDDKGTKIPPLFMTYKKADLEIFSIFLLHPEISLYFGSSTLLHYFFEKFKDLKDYELSSEMTIKEKKCFDLILKTPRCDRDYLNKADENGYPAIYYSVKYGIDYMTIKLLENGAYIGPVITNIRKSLLNDFLDSCITSNSKFQDDKEFKLTVNYRFLEPPSDNNKHELNEIEIKIQNSSVEKLNNPDESQENHDIYVPEMASLQKLISNTNLRQIIMHPVLSSFVFLKWRKIRFLIYLNLVLTLMYIFSFIPLILLIGNKLNSTWIFKILYLISLLSISLMICREASQFILSPKRYFLSFSNYIDMALISASLAILFQFHSRAHQLRMLNTIVILLAMWEYFNLLGYLPLLSVSLYTKIFRKVFITFLKSLAFFSVMIIGFALAFYTLHGDKFAQSVKKHFDMPEEPVDINIGELPTNQTRADRFNNFNTIGHSIVKSIVMMTGELDAHDIHLEGFTYSGLFLLYLFIVTIILYNLLNALAVSDTQEIKIDAKLIDLRQRVTTMHDSEASIFHGFLGGRLHKIGVFLKKFISMFPNFIENGEIYLRPNADSDPQLKLNQEIIDEMCTLLLKTQEERATDRKRKLKESNYEKLSCDIIRMNEVINNIQKSVIKSAD
ncbi:transient receptor potential cation channel protein painless-like [Chironomus tepperi]|uniref:transient receptor potential cation channel protein painless-like n=1 Tax=Chironomus tepperi TaxID=113505 RepID=UPI00391F6F8B